MIHRTLGRDSLEIYTGTGLPGVHVQLSQYADRLGLRKQSVTGGKVHSSNETGRHPEGGKLRGQGTRSNKQ